jgi:hypothetical protein
MLSLADSSIGQATHELQDSTSPDLHHAAVWAQIATAHSIQALAAAAKAIADAMNFNAKP